MSGSTILWLGFDARRGPPRAQCWLRGRWSRWWSRSRVDCKDRGSRRDCGRVELLMGRWLWGVLAKISIVMKRKWDRIYRCCQLKRWHILRLLHSQHRRVQWIFVRHCRKLRVERCFWRDSLLFWKGLLMAVLSEWARFVSTYEVITVPRVWLPPALSMNIWGWLKAGKWSRALVISKAAIVEEIRVEIKLVGLMKVLVDQKNMLLKPMSSWTRRWELLNQYNTQPTGQLVNFV